LFTTLTTVMGAIIMTIGAVMYFAVFFKTLFSKTVNEPVIEFPITEAYHDEKNIGILKNFTPWIVAAVIIIAISYYGPITDAMKNNIKASPTYDPASPVPTSIMKLNTAPYQESNEE